MEDNYVVKYDGYDPDSPEGHIILSMYQNAHLEQSILFADCIEKQFTTGLARKSRGVKQAGFLVLRNTTMPSVLIETGFLSHDTDEAYLGDVANHTHVASSIFNAFSEYKGQMEGSIPSLDESVAEVPANPSVVHAKAEPHQKVPVKTVVKTSETGGEMPGPEKKADVKPAIPSITFFVQLAASRTPLPEGQQHWPGTVAMETRQENGYYKYLAGPFTTVDQANAVQQQLKAGKWKDAFVVAYKDKLRITLAEAAATR
jgi:N-acetylmuramoyl-L-alanine amidase